MDKVKNFFVNHFEKLAVVVAILITMIFLIGVFRRGRADELGEDIQVLIDTITDNMKKAGVEDRYNPQQVPPYDEQALGPFKNVPTGVDLAGVRWYPRVIMELEPITLELPPGVPFEKQFTAYPEIEKEDPPETTVVRIDNEDLGTVQLTDPQHFILRRAADLPAEDDTTLIHIYYADERHAVRRLEVTIRVVYIPQPPPEETIAGYPKPGRNFVIWETHPDDLENVVGFNIYRKESEEAEFDVENPLNREKLIDPLSYVPKMGEDEEGILPEGEGEAPEGEGEAPVGEEEPEQEGEERRFELPGLGEEMVEKRTRNIFDDKVGGKFVDRDVTPLQTYWYAIQTVAKKPEEERGKGEVGGKEVDLYTRSVLSEPVMIKGGDVIKIVFRSIMGNPSDPELKKQARAGIEVRRFVKTDWVVGKFNHKIGDRVGGKAWVRKYPVIDPETGEIDYVGKMVDFTSKYTLEDIVVVKKQEKYIEWKLILNKETGRMRREPVEKFREVKSYKIILRHDDGSSKECALQKPQRRRPVPTTGTTEKREEPEDRRRTEAEERRKESERRRLEAQRRLMEEEQPMPRR